MSFWSKLAKIGLVAAPIAAAPFTGGASLALISAAAGAGAGAMGGGGWKGALIGGGMGAGGAALGGALSGAGKAAMPTIAGTAGQTSAELGSTAATQIVANAGNAGRAASMNALSKALTNRDLWAAGGKMATAAAKGLQEEREARQESRGSDWQQMQFADYVAGGGGSYGGNVAAPSRQERQIAGRLRADLEKRLGKSTEPGVGEYLAGGVGLGLAGLSAADQMRRQEMTDQEWRVYLSALAKFGIDPYNSGGR